MTRPDPLRCLLTIDEAADMYGLTASVMRHWVEDRRLTPVGKRGRAHLFLGLDVAVLARTRLAQQRRQVDVSLAGVSSE